MKQCNEPNCSNPPFNEFCRYHQFRLYMQGGRLHKPKGRTKSKIPRESAKRKEDKKYYTQNCKELTQELKDANNGRLFCFFSGREITGTPIYHHLRGRSGDFYTDKKYLVPCINKYHLMYHFTPIQELIKETWFPEFLIKLREKSEDLYNKEMRKQDKSINYIEKDSEEDLF